MKCKYFYNDEGLASCDCMENESETRCEFSDPINCAIYLRYTSEYRRAGEGELGCLACDESEGNDEEGLACDRLCREVCLQCRCKYFKESPFHARERARAELEAKLQAEWESKQRKLTEYYPGLTKTRQRKC